MKKYIVTYIGIAGKTSLQFNTYGKALTFANKWNGTIKIEGANLDK